MTDILILAGLLLCSVQAVRVKYLLSSAIWLAGASAATAILLYRLGAHEIAVIELSVGAGLVTVLFVFAISIAGEEALPDLVSIPRWLSILVIITAMGLFAWMSLPAFNITPPGAKELGLTSILWQNRGLDVLLQIVFVFSGVLGVIGLLGNEMPTMREEGGS